jgi:DNA-binding transcriptional MerR regulator
MDASGLPDRPFFKIGEAARLCGVKPYVLRYWETEFRSVKPEKTRSQQRLYRRRDVELLLKIRHLLYDKRYTIEGARSRLRDQGHDEGPVVAPPPATPPTISREALQKIKQGLADLIRICAE